MVACAQVTSGDLKVLSVLTATQDESQCPAATDTYRTYSDTNRVLCFVDAT